jgi:signal transduction histidine kinase
MAKQIVIARRESGNMKGESRIQTIATLSSSIVHEVKNYLAAIHVCVELSERELVAIKKTVNAADYLISNLQLQINGIVAGKPSKESFKICFMAKDIKEALERYPFKIGERELITVEGDKGFKYRGNSTLTMHILYNLIRNSLRVIENAGKGKITIKLESGGKFNRLIFRDTASGIKKDFLSKIFKLFESKMTGQGGTGVGLAYCKEIMLSYGGDIACNSAEGEYAEFALSFPLQKSK